VNKSFVSHASLTEQAWRPDTERPRIPSKWAACYLSVVRGIEYDWEHCLLLLQAVRLRPGSIAIVLLQSDENR
jgi:hypothetical protein